MQEETNLPAVQSAEPAPQELTATQELTAAQAKAKLKAEKKKKKKSRKKLIIWSIVILLIVGYIGFAMYQKANFVPIVKADEVSRQNIKSFLNTTTTITSSDSSSYFAPPNSKALKLNFKVGDRVKKGDVIATYDLTDIEKQIALAQISYSDAKLAKDNAIIAKDNAEIARANSELGLENTKIAGEDILKSDIDREKEIDNLSRDIQTYNNILRKIEAGGGPPDNVSDGTYQRYVLIESKLTKAIQERDRLQSTVTKESAKTKSKNDIANAENSLKNADNALKNANNAIISASNSMKSASINIASLQKYKDIGGIVADFDGIITEMNLVEGGSCPSSAACIIQTTDGLKGKFNIGKYDLGTIKVGQPATLTLGSLSYKGKVSKIGSAAVRTQNSSGKGNSTPQVPAEIFIENPDSRLVIGLDFDVDIETSSKTNVISIPVEAILTDRNGDFCYKLTPTAKKDIFTYEKTYIQTGTASDTFMEVLSGVAEGDKVVLTPPATIEAIPLVKVMPNAPAVNSASASSNASAPAA
ncbi:MAG: HlyD family efflux transporter periplasmic adaptor subunit [Hydrogenoanaerobacterium sp.]